MLLRFETFSWFAASALFVGAAGCGFVSTVFTYYALKRLLQPACRLLGQHLPSPEERGQLVPVQPMRLKLVAAVAGVVTCTVALAMFAAHARSMGPVEAHVTRIQARYIQEIAERYEWDGAAGLRNALGYASQLGIADALLVFDATTLEILEGDGSVLHDDELRLIVESGVEAGDSTDVDSPHVLTWQELAEEGHYIVAVSEWTPLSTELAGNRTVFLVLLTFAALMAVALALCLASDISGATERLRREAERLASGDLRPGDVSDGDDELGALSRAFESMAQALRGTVARVAEAADRVEATAGQMADTSVTMAAVSADQASGIEQTTSSMDVINQQVRGIADSAQGLNGSVEESSSSVLELGAAGEELNQTAHGLSERVNEVSSSIEQMVRSVKQVLENTESLSQAAVETSSSMGEMATSMREVDSAAEETARLSTSVVEYAESGQKKMVQTIEGMDAIREATETAERVIRGLGSRASEIGAVVDVIDDVADETNLLALNAAIIAAQAGEQGRAFSGRSRRDQGSRGPRAGEHEGDRVADPRGAGRECQRDRRDRARFGERGQRRGSHGGSR